MLLHTVAKCFVRPSVAFALLISILLPSLALADLTVIGEIGANQQQEGLEPLPEFWEQNNDTQAIQQKRQKLMEEALGQKKFETMRSALEKLKAQQEALQPPPTPDNILLEVKLMEQVNQQSSINNDNNNGDQAIPAQKVPVPRRVNKPIEDLMYGGDMLLRNDQAEEAFAELLAENKTTDTTGEHLHGKRTKRQVIKGQLFPLNQWATSQPICFTFDSSISENTKHLVRLATQYWQDHTCVSFQENCAWSPKVRVFKGQGCYSEVGRDIYSAQQQLSLGTGCEIFGTVTHEFGHVLGLYHHHSRIDRDSFINLITENIAPSWRPQYAKAPLDRVDNEGQTYEYGSVMHYGGTDADTDKIIMAAVHKRYQHTMGRNVGPSFQDLVTINKYYGCMEKCRTGADCKNNGFRNPRNCKICICPAGFGGDECTELAPGENGPPANCGKVLPANDATKKLSGKVTPNIDAGRLLADKAGVCHWQIRAPDGQRVKIQIESLNGTCTPECFFGAVEIKLGQFTKAGIRVCCEKHIAEVGKMVSDGELAIISVYSQRGDRSFALNYTATTDAATKDDDILGNGASSSSSYSNLLTALSGILNNQQSCVDTNTICPMLGKMNLCKMPAYEAIRKTTCKKTCNCCGANKC